MALSHASIVQLRLRDQWIGSPHRGTAAEVVDHLVAVQSQDYAGAKWSLGLRLRGAVEAEVEQAIDAGKVLRTHVLRPTWHFVLPKDIRWLLALTGPRVQAASAGAYRRSRFDAAILRRAHAVLTKALRGGQFLTRDELRERLEAAGIDTSRDNGLAHLMMHAELEGLICSGPRRGKQFTYALLDERVPPAKELSRDEALSELARRYGLSRGAATAHDFAKWSGLTLADCRLGLEAASPTLRKETLDGQDYWLSDAPSVPRAASPSAYLLSIYDEYFSSYRGHTAIAPEQISKRLRGRGSALTGVMIFDGLVAGTWKRTLTKDRAVIKLDPFDRLTPIRRKAFAAAAQQYGDFHGVRAVVS